MRKYASPFCFIVITVFLAACSKPGTTNNSTPSGSNLVSLAYGGSIAIPSTASGALYAISDNITRGGVTTVSNAAYAWFGSDTLTQQVGFVTCSGDTLATSLGSYSFNWYETEYSQLQGRNLSFSGSSVPWFISGNGTFAGFTYTDNTPFPVANFTVPASISSSAALTVNFSITNPYDLVFCSLSDGRRVGVYSNFTSANSVTFTAAQVTAATLPGGDTVTIQIMPVVMTPFGIGGKAYYFVKQNAFAQTTVTQ
jgi:hypothetical protein